MKWMYVYVHVRMCVCVRARARIRTDSPRTAEVHYQVILSRTHRQLIWQGKELFQNAIGRGRTGFSLATMPFQSYRGSPFASAWDFNVIHWTISRAPAYNTDSSWRCSQIRFLVTYALEVSQIAVATAGRTPWVRDQSTAKCMQPLSSLCWVFPSLYFSWSFLL
jgi:hypothetical protein